MNKHNTNLEFLKQSRKQLKPGDIFVLKPKGRDYYYGRVISTTADCGFGPPKAVLVYIYNATSKNKCDIPALDKKNLLIPPVMINRLGWSRGYFETIEHKELTIDDVLKVHCFWSRAKEVYINEKGQQLDEPHEPIGFYGLSNYRVIDDRISELLEIPLAPD
jgi:hypothetical protein